MGKDFDFGSMLREICEKNGVKAPTEGNKSGSVVRGTVKESDKAQNKQDR